MNKKLEFCASFKTIMMLFVVLGHACIIYSGFWSAFPPATESKVFDFLVRWLDTFHTYTFVFISGFIFYYMKYIYKKYQNGMSIIKKKAKRLIKPYIITCVIWAIPVAFLVRKMSVKTVFHKYILGEDPDQLWFLLMLFWAFVFSVVIFRFVDFDNLKIIYKILLLGICVGGYLCTVGLRVIEMPDLFGVQAALEYELFFVGGMVYASLENDWITKLNKNTFMGLEIVLLTASLLGAALYNYYLGRVIKYLIFPIVSFCGIFFWTFLVQRWSYIKKDKAVRTQSKLWNYLMKNNFYIYLIHQQLIYISLNLINKSAVPPVVVVLINFIIALLGSSMIWFVTSKIYGKYIHFINTSKGSFLGTKL